MATRNQVSKNNAKISEALELLNEAAKGKQDELRDLMTSKYSDIREAMTSGVGRGHEILEQAKDFAHEAIAEGSETIKKVASATNEKVHKDSWSYIAGAAAVSLLLGYLLGSKHRQH